MIKDLFERSLFIPTTFDKKEKKQSRILTLIMMILFVCASFAFFYFIYDLCNIVGSIISLSPDIALRDFLRVLFVNFNLTFLCIYMLVSVYKLRHCEKEGQKKLILKNGYTIIGISASSILYVIIGRIAGIYNSFIEGLPTLIFPLDIVLLFVVILLIGVFSVLYAKKWIEKYPYLPMRNKITSSKLRILHGIGLVIWLLASLFGFAAFFLGFNLIQWTKEGIFYSVMLELLFLLPTFNFLFYEFYVKEIKDNKINILVPAIFILGLSLLVVTLYNVAYVINPEATVLYTFGLNPVDYTAGVNSSTYIYVTVNLAFPILAIIKSLIAKRKIKNNN